MTRKETYFIKVWDHDTPSTYGVGECAVFRGLGSDDTPQYESILANVCRDIDNITTSSISQSSIRFGLETALRDLKNGGVHNIFPSSWQNGETGIPINGLVWMGDFDLMLKRIDEKVAANFNCIKIKIGGIDFNHELQLLSYIRDCYNSRDLEIRLDANGSMTPRDALHKLDMLSRYDIHSIEQPVMPGQWQAFREIVKNSPIDIALDEELIGVQSRDSRLRLLDALMPRYIILKPSLHGGFEICERWISEATERGIDWWATSALESNIGLNAIAQWAASIGINRPQGLGTGSLYSNNISAPLEIRDAKLYYNPNKTWGEING